MAEKWEVVKQPFEREIVRTVEYGVFAKNGKKLVANVTSSKDALLCAASPLMLEALQRLLYLIERNDSVTHNIEYADSTILDQARAAIAAAKGE
jgi:hypothetical protein